MRAWLPALLFVGGCIAQLDAPRAAEPLGNVPESVLMLVSNVEHGDLATLTLAPALKHWLPLATEPVHAGDVLQLWGYGCGARDGVSSPLARAAIAVSDHAADATTCDGDSGGAVIGVDGVAGILHGHDGERAEFTAL